MELTAIVLKRLQLIACHLSVLYDMDYGIFFSFPVFLQGAKEKRVRQCVLVFSNFVNEGLQRV